MTTPDRTAIDRVWSALSPAARRTLEMELPPADLRSLQQGRGYYAGAALRLLVDVDGVRVEVGDGGLTNWTAQLAGNAKERCLVSCASVERLGEFI